MSAAEKNECKLHFVCLLLLRGLDDECCTTYCTSLVYWIILANGQQRVRQVLTIHYRQIANGYELETSLKHVTLWIDILQMLTILKTDGIISTFSWFCWATYHKVISTHTLTSEKSCITSLVIDSVILINTLTTPVCYYIIWIKFRVSKIAINELNVQFIKVWQGFNTYVMYIGYTWRILLRTGTKRQCQNAISQTLIH